MLNSTLQFLAKYAAVSFTWTAIVASIGGVLGGWVLTLMGMPGNWLILGIAVVYDFLLAPAGAMQLGWPVLIILAILAIVGEVVEFATGAIGVAKTGGSRRSAVVALLGSFVGGIGGAIIGLPIPIPIAGPVIGLLLFASLGALVGAVVGEYSVRKEIKGSLKVGVAAFAGRIFGSIGKTLVGGVMVVLYLASLVL